MSLLFKKNGILIVLLSISLSCSFFMGQFWVNDVFAGQVFYVYKDKQGRTHIEDSIPGELTKYGYKIINERGITIKEVPSVAHKVKKAKVQERLNDVERKRKAQRKKDQLLLRRFTGVDDIRETGNKKILALQSQINLTKSHIKAFEKNLKDLQNQAQALHKNSILIARDDRDEIDRLKENILENKSYIRQRRAEQKKVKSEFSKLMQRYKVLIGAK